MGAWRCIPGVFGGIRGVLGDSGGVLGEMAHETYETSSLSLDISMLVRASNAKMARDVAMMRPWESQDGAR